MAWTPAKLPYLKPPNQLPAPLPSENDILESTTVFKGDVSHHRVVAVGPHFIVKYGRRVNELEGQVLHFLEHHACPGVPKLYGMYRVHSTGYVSLIMERIPGESLEQVWSTLTELEKSEICAKLKKQFLSIRRIPAPNIYGSVVNGAFYHYLFYSPENDKEICGPFDSEEQLNVALVKHLRSNWASMNMHSFRADWYEKVLNRTLHGHKPIFTHSDLQRKNVIVHRDPSHGLTVGVVDWEEAGWFPTYWEYFTALEAVKWDDDWSQRIEEILDPWLSEAAVMKMVHKDLMW